MAQELNFQDYSDRQPPQNVAAEESILGGILLDPEALGRVTDILKLEAFSIQLHREIYRAALALHSQGKPTDLMNVMAWLRDRDLLEKVGGQNKLLQLLSGTVSAVNIDGLAKLVMEKYLRRQLIQAGNDIVQLGYDTATELETILSQAEQKIFNLTQSRPTPGLVPISDTLVGTFQELELRNQELALPGLPCNFYDLDAMTGGFQLSDLIIVAGRPSMGKCCVFDTEIALSDGSIATIEEIYHRRQAELLTLGSDRRFHLTQPSAFVDDGIKPVFRVTTKLGRFVESTLPHPYLTVNGWRRLSELLPGDRIAVPSRIDVFGTQTIPECQVKLLAYLIGERCLTTSSPQFTNSNPVLPAIRLQDNGVCDKSDVTETIPPIVFKLKRSQLALFLNCLFGTDKWATALESDRARLGYATVSEKLARQVQHLLLRFGIIAQLEKRCVKYKGTIRESWQVDINDAQSINTFISEIGIIGNESALPVQQLAMSEVYWDEIVSIEPVGYKQVYDLTIPETHNFVANDICVHNTSFAVNIARNIAEIHKLPVAIFSLEMSKEQLVQRLLATESGIESNRLRSGRITQNEWEPLIHAVGTLSALPIFIDDSQVSVIQMRSLCRRLQAEQGGHLGLILLDYLQLMEGGGDNRVQELSKITRSLKGLARELNVPIIALSQLSRGVEARTNKRPMMSDLRESGSIEQDADLIMMIYRDSYYNPDSPDRDITEIIVAKHRNGPTGTVKLLFNPQYTQFRNIAK